jgi:EAL domain-containing protein (putative c-di-GMP-specific phosphodiesterase class I)
MSLAHALTKKILVLFFTPMVHTFFPLPSHGTYILVLIQTQEQILTAQSLISWKGVKPNYEITERWVLFKTEQRQAKEEKEMRGGYKSINFSSSEMLVSESMSLSNAIMYGKDNLWRILLMMS